MKESEVRLTTAEAKKEKIRERYKGVSEDQLSVIPAVPKLDIFDKDRNLRVLQDLRTCNNSASTFRPRGHRL